MTKVLILGGTREAADLAEKLISEGHDVTTSLAGRTKEPKPLKGKTRIGGFGGVDGLASYLEDEQIELLIDCTHPFAKQITKNAKLASERTATELQIITRPQWKNQSGDIWIEVSDLNEACTTIPNKARVLLALGSQYIDLFKTRDDVFFLVRMVDEPSSTLPLPNHQVLIGKPSLSVEDEKHLLLDHAITHIVCRNSGGLGAYAKIEAARDLQLPVIMIQQS